MKQKRQINWYQPNDSEAIARHMEKMAAKGWLLEKVGQMTWSFRREEPRAVRYAVTYFPGASVFDGGPTQGQETYFDFCQAAGWEFVSSYGPIQYFRSTRPDPPPIETDEAEKLRVIHQTMSKTLVLSHALLLFSQAIWIGNQWRSFQYDPLGSISSLVWVNTLLLFAVFVLYLAGILADYFIWYFRSKRAVARGGSCVRVHTRARLWCSFALLAFLAADILVLLWGYLADPSLRYIFFYAFLGILAILALSRGVLWLMKRQGCSRGAVRGGFIVSVVVLSILYTAGMIPAASTAARAARGDGAVYSYTTRWGSQWPIYRDELPVTLEDLGYQISAEDHCSYRATEQRSPLAAYGEYSQETYETRIDLPCLNYEVCRISSNCIREACWEMITGEDRWPQYGERMDVLPEGALEGLRSGVTNDYALLYPDRIILVSLRSTPPEDHLNQLMEKLMERVTQIFL